MYYMYNIYLYYMIQVPSYFVIKPWFADSLDPPAASTQSSQSISTSVHLQGSLPKFSL